MPALAGKLDFVMQAECKLGDSSGGKVDVSSTWRAYIRVTEEGAQTEPIALSSSGCQSCTSEEAGVRSATASPDPDLLIFHLLVAVVPLAHSVAVLFSVSFPLPHWSEDRRWTISNFALIV